MDHDKFCEIKKMSKGATIRDIRYTPAGWLSPGHIEIDIENPVTHISGTVSFTYG